MMFFGVYLSLEILQCSFRVQDWKYKQKKITQCLSKRLGYDILIKNFLVNFN